MKKITTSIAQSQAYWSAADAWAMAHLKPRRGNNKQAPEAAAGAQHEADERARLSAARARRLSSWAAESGVALHRSAAVPGQSITVGPELWEIVSTALASVAPAVMNAYDKHLARLAFQAWREWPVATGWSRSLLALEYTSPTPHLFIGTLVSHAGYTRYIAGQPFRKLVDSKARAVVMAMGRDAIDDLGDTSS